jgi:hypothetical protein
MMIPFHASELWLGDVRAARNRSPGRTLPTPSLDRVAQKMQPPHVEFDCAMAGGGRVTRGGGDLVGLPESAGIARDGGR